MSWPSALQESDSEPGASVDPLAPSASSRYAVAAGERARVSIRMNCPRCGAAVQANARFCSECGNALSASCRNCGSALQPGAKFCTECGTPVGAVIQATGGIPADGTNSATTPA